MKFFSNKIKAKSTNIFSH